MASAASAALKLEALHPAPSVETCDVEDAKRVRREEQAKHAAQQEAADAGEPLLEPTSFQESM